jgi:hypothetical protein
MARTAHAVAADITSTYDDYTQFEAVAINGCGEWEIDSAHALAEEHGLEAAEVISAIESICKEKCQAA